VIPKKIFKILEEISVILINKVKDMDTKIIKDTLKDYACFEDRYRLAKLTHEITLFTEGITLDPILMGVINIEPHEILVDGIRYELGKTLSKVFHEGFIFKGKGDPNEFEVNMKALRNKIGGLKRSIEYISDFLNIYGDKIWNEEIARVIDFAVEKESTKLVSKKQSA